MFDLLGMALALLLVLEGLLPFFSPGLWRKFVERVRTLSDAQIRAAGLGSMLLGLLLLWVQSP